ncbi:hypothetical protein [Yokenella regensburgei]|uniref:hypothetical protein n=1 Tax=Yokenella regensburgei TaxID=158877 RepID=UPI003EDB18E9
MPYSRELQEKETLLTETEEEMEEEYATDPWALRDSPAGAGSPPPPDEGGGLPPEGGNDSLFSFITEEHLLEAQEFRRQGYNRQIPTAAPGLLTKLREALTDARSRLVTQASVEGPLGSGWLLNHVDQIKKLADFLSDDGMQRWVELEVPRDTGWITGEVQLGSRYNAQSLVRRLESILQTLLRVVHFLCTIDDHSTRDRREALLVAELIGAFPPGDKKRVEQALDMMKEERAGYSAWNTLIQDRGAAWEADQAAGIGEMIKLARHEEDKAYEKLTELQGEGAHDFLSAAAGYFTWLRQDLIKASADASQSAASPAMPFVNKDKKSTQSTEDVQDVYYYMANYFLPGELDKALANASLAASSSHLDTFGQGVDTGLIKLKVVGAVAKKTAYSVADFIRQRRLTKTSPDDAAVRALVTRILMNWSTIAVPLNSEEILEASLSQKSPEKTKHNERDIAGSIIRSILWQWQQAAIKIQHASGAILSKVEELQKVEGMFLTYARESHPEGQDTPVSYPGGDDMEAQVRQWVNDSLEPEAPEEKVAALKQLLDADIDRARSLVARLGNTEESIQNTLRKQQSAVRNMLFKRLNAVAPSLKAVDARLPKVAKDLAKSIAALGNALQLAGNPPHNFVGAKNQASKAQLEATVLKENLSAMSAELTGRSLNEHSRGARLAKHWANLAKGQVQGNHPAPDAAKVLASLKTRGGLEGVLSAGDPEGYLFATRLTAELENARNDELRLPMSPEQYTALEKGLVEYIVKWGQKRVSRGAARMIIELSFEQGLDAVSFGVSRLIRLPYKVLKATIKVPYNVSKVNNYTMPGQDKPYKAIYGMLEKRLKQLGFNLVTAPVPGVIKAAAGGVITAGATLYNLYVEKKEDTFSAVYERLTTGTKSEKIKMQSVGEMAFDAVSDTGISAAYKVGYKSARMAWQSGKEAKMKTITSAINRISEKLPWETLMSEENEEARKAYAAELDKYQQMLWEAFLAEQDENAREHYVAEKEKYMPMLWEAWQARQDGNTEETDDIDEGLRADGVDDPERENAQTSEQQPRARRERRAAAQPVATSRAVPAQSDDSDGSSNVRYHDLKDVQKKQTYAFAIRFILDKIQKDGNLSAGIQYRAMLAIQGGDILVPVDIRGSKLNNTIFLPVTDGAKTGVLICLDSNPPYYIIGDGSDLPEELKAAMPYGADVLPEHVAQRKKTARRLGPASGVADNSFEGEDFFTTIEAFDQIKTGRRDFSKYFNYNTQVRQTINDISEQLFTTISSDYSLKGKQVTNDVMVPRAIAGAMIKSSVSASRKPYTIEVVWGGSTASEYLKAFSQPFSSLAEDIQKIISSSNGESVAEAEKNIERAGYIGSWVDTTVGAVTSFTPQGLVYNLLQSSADIIADVLRHKAPDPIAVASLIAGCIPQGHIVAKVGTFTRRGSKVVHYGLMLGTKVVDLAMVGNSIKVAIETRDPLAIYQSLLTIGMSVRNSYEMAKNMTPRLNISGRIEDIAPLERFEAISNDAPGTVLPRNMTVRTFNFGGEELRGRINNGEIEISSDGVNWDKGNKFHLLAYRLQNAGGAGGKLPKFVHNQEIKAATVITTRDSPGLIAEPLNLELKELETLTNAQQQECNAARTLLERDSRIGRYIRKPSENCADAAQTVTELLSTNGYTNIRFAELGFWVTDYDGPENHFVVFASRNGVDIAVDITAGQFHRGEMQGPIYTTPSNWKLIVKDAFGRGGRLVKYKEFSVPFRFELHGKPTADIFGPGINPFSTIEGGEILVRPRWHKRVFETLNFRESAYRQFNTLIDQTLAIPNGASSAKTPWDFVLQLQSDASLLTTNNDVRLLTTSWNMSKARSKFLGPDEKRISTREQLSKIPKGSRLQLAILEIKPDPTDPNKDIETEVSLHPMLSLGEGNVISIDNSWMGKGYGDGIQKISLLNDLVMLPKVGNFKLKGVRGEIIIRAESNNRLPTIESSPSRTEAVSETPPQNAEGTSGAAPVNTDEQLLDNARYSGYSSRGAGSFDELTVHHKKINPLSNFVLRKMFGGQKIQSFDPGTKTFINSDEFKIVKDSELSAGRKIASVNDMAVRVQSLINSLSNYNGPGKEEISGNMNIMKSMIEDAQDVANNNSMYMLVGKSADSNSVSNHYGLVMFDYSGRELTIQGLMSHPYAVVNKYPEFKEYVISRGLVSEETLNKYNIRNVAKYLAGNAVEKEIDYYKYFPNSSVKTLTFHGANPITQRIGREFDRVLRFLSMEQSTQVEDYAPRRRTDEEIYDARMEVLDSNVRTSFNVIEPSKIIAASKIDEFIKSNMREFNADLVSEDINSSQSSSDVEISGFSRELIKSVDRAYEKVKAVKNFLDQADSNAGIKDAFKKLLNEAIGLNDDVAIQIDTVSVSDISSMAYDRFEKNINRTYKYLSEQKNNNYPAYNIYKHKNTASSNTDKPVVYGFALPNDIKKRIFIAIPPEGKPSSDVTETVVHESTHVAAGTQDHTYLGGARDIRGSFPLTLDPLLRGAKHFDQNATTRNLSSKYALGLSETSAITSAQEEMAQIILNNSRLVKADTLLNSAEYNTYMIDVLSRGRIRGSSIELDTTLSRNKRSAPVIPDNLDHTVLQASLRIAMSLQENDSAARSGRKGRNNKALRSSGIIGV